MKTHRASASDVRLSPLLDRVYVAGDHVEIARRGEVVARLVPAECTWEIIDTEPVGYLAGCGGQWWPSDDAEVSMAFCPHCAGRIIREGDDV